MKKLLIVVLSFALLFSSCFNSNNFDKQTNEYIKELEDAVNNTLDANTMQTVVENVVTYDKTPPEGFATVMLFYVISSTSLTSEDPRQDYIHMKDENYDMQYIKIVDLSYDAGIDAQGNINVHEWKEPIPGNNTIHQSRTDTISLEILKSYLHATFAVLPAIESITKDGNTYTITISSEYLKNIDEQLAAISKQADDERNQLSYLENSSASDQSEVYTVLVEDNYAVEITRVETVNSLLRNEMTNEVTDEKYFTTLTSHFTASRINDETINDDIMQIYEEKFKQ